MEADGEMDADGLTDALGLTEGEALADGETDALGLMLRLILALGETDGETLALGETEGDALVNQIVVSMLRPQLAIKRAAWEFAADESGSASAPRAMGAVFLISSPATCAAADSPSRPPSPTAFAAADSLPLPPSAAVMAPARRSSSSSVLRARSWERMPDWTASSGSVTSSWREATRMMW